MTPYTSPLIQYENQISISLRRSADAHPQQLFHSAQMQRSDRHTCADGHHVGLDVCSLKEFNRQLNSISSFSVTREAVEK